MSHFTGYLRPEVRAHVGRYVAAMSAAIGVPVAVMLVMFPPQPGPRNDMPMLVGVVLVGYVTAAAAFVTMHFATTHPRVDQ